MTRAAFHQLTCDRCGKTQDVRELGDDAGWAKLGAYQDMPDARPREVGSAGLPGDLCPGCGDGLFNWWATRSDAPPAPPPPPKVTPKPRSVGIEAKKRARVLAATSLRDQAMQAVEAIREQPSSILDNDIVLPGCFAGIDRRAEALVEILAVDLERTKK